MTYQPDPVLLTDPETRRLARAWFSDEETSDTPQAMHALEQRISEVVGPDGWEDWDIVCDPQGTAYVLVTPPEIG